MYLVIVLYTIIYKSNEVIYFSVAMYLVENFLLQWLNMIAEINHFVFFMRVYMLYMLIDSLCELFIISFILLLFLMYNLLLFYYYLLYNLHFNLILTLFTI